MKSFGLVEVGLVWLKFCLVASGLIWLGTTKLLVDWSTGRVSA